MTRAPDLVSLAEALRSRLPADALSFDPDPRYAVDGLRPAFVAAPATPEDVGATLAAANDAGAAVIPFGGGTQMHLGMPPERYDLALDLRRLDRVIEYEPADLTVTVEAGVRLAELQRVLAQHGQWLPLDPPLPAAATIGGVLATNASGPARHRYGTARDLLIGIRVATAAGELVKAGGRVVKNVAGYDMGKLHIGALGTLGVIVQASFKVAPLPAQTAIAAVAGPLTALMSITSRLIDARLPLDALVLTKDASEPDWRLRVCFAGGEAAVQRSQRELAAIAPDAAVGATLAVALDAPLVVRASVLPTTNASICEALAALGAGVVAYPTVGIVYGVWTDAPPADALVDLRRRCVEAHGALVIERARSEQKRAVGVWGPTRADFGLMRRLKEELDPRRVLNPGRYLGGI